MTRPELEWQSKLVLLLVVPFVAAGVVLQAHWWTLSVPPVALWTIGLSTLLGLAAWQSRSATPGAAATGAVICATLMFSTAPLPYQPWRTALIPVATLLILTALGTRLGRQRKLQLGTAESRTGRNAAQVAANLGAAALFSNELTQAWLIGHRWIPDASWAPNALFAPGLAALAEAAADTLSSELGQLLSSRPRMITTLRTAQPGVDGAISLGGTFVGALAAAIVSAAGALALSGGWLMFAFSWIGALFGLFFDSLLGATLERRGWLNNDGVNYLSTVSAALFTLGAMAFASHFGLR